MQQQGAGQSVAAAVLLPFARADELELPSGASAPRPVSEPGRIPRYLQAHYWWAYVHPNAVRVFERDWLVNLILWGNYNRLRDAVLTDMKPFCSGRTLQVACVYGDLTSRLGASVAGSGGSLDVVDVLSIQLQNLRNKLPHNSPARLLQMDSAKLDLPDDTYDQALAFFLLHEQPSHYRERTLRELMRVVKPGGKVILVDYALPRFWHPLRYLWRPLLARLEPFALDLWRHEISRWLPRIPKGCLHKTTYFGGLYQKMVIVRP
jgi:ubiquinone/menaquinone biosynthesis C-methylase UbiE